MRFYVAYMIRKEKNYQQEPIFRKEKKNSNFPEITIIINDYLLLPNIFELLNQFHCWRLWRFLCQYLIYKKNRILFFHFNYKMLQ